jgi:hypothetical protein
MNHKYLSRSVISFAFIFFCVAFSFGQSNRNFTKDKKFFIDEIRAFFKEDKNSEKEQKLFAENVVNEFQLLWNGEINENQQNQIIVVSNLMLKAKMRPFPHFISFLTCLNSFKKSSQKDNSFDAFLRSLPSMLDTRNTRYFQPFIENTTDLITNRNIYNSRATRWVTNSDDFEFSFDTVVKIIFPSLDLYCYANKDSSVIYDTKGVYYPIDNKWLGNGGKVNWERAGFTEKEVYALLGDYQINMKFAKYEVDSVKFYNTNYFSSFLIGNLQEKVLSDVTEDRASYPRFSSYDKRLVIKNIFNDIDYEGGFAMFGAKLMGSGDKFQDAYLYFKKDGKIFVKTASKSYTIRKDRISSNFAAVSIFWKGDSIYHPGLELKYIDITKELTLIRGLTDLSLSPFFDTYHKLDMYFEALYWKMDKSSIDFSMIKVPGRTSQAFFESANYYSEARFSKLQGIDEIHPLYRVKKYVDSYQTNEIYVDDLAKQMKIAPEQVKAMLIRLANLGFLIYDADDEVVYVKDKVYEYIKALNKKTDYDIIQFQSTVEDDINASLSLLDFDLKIKGVPVVLLSDSQNVFIYPSNQEVTVKKNRDFSFSGRIHAGRFDYFAKGCSFIYDDFKLNMPVIDSLSFKVLAFQTNDKGERPLVRVQNVLQDLKGEILVDYPTNKSGLKNFPQYPIFTSKEPSYVYYNRQNIQRGVYTKDKFYFVVKPFSIDSLDNFETENIKFDGSLTSAGIFPEINEPLKVQPDYSLGFVKSTPIAGLPAYGGKGKYYNKINLSNQGLRGDGRLEYITSTTHSNDFLFLPDSMKAVANKFEIKAQTTLTEYPQLAASNVSQFWRPYKDSLISTQIDQPFQMYNNESKLNGRVVLMPSGLTGRGKIEFEKAEMESNLYKFKEHVFDSDTANFRLRTYDLTDLAFNTENYKSHIDFKKRIGEFKSNGGVSKVNFPVNRYICYMDMLDWYMDKEEIALRNTKKPGSEILDKMPLKDLLSYDLPGSDFVSTHPSQDSLKFRATKAIFNMKDYVLTAQDVKLIRVADAVIAPENGKVTILRQAEMQQLNNSLILADTAKKYHYMYKARTIIQGKKNYIATAYYDYTDENDKKHQIFFDKVGVDPNNRTYATGKISDSSDFALSPAFDFAGEVQLKANKQNLYFIGGTQLFHACTDDSKIWLKFNSEINPKEILIPIDAEPKEVNGRKLASAILYSNTGQIYTAFASPKRVYSDSAVISANGFITYKKDKKEYWIASKTKLSNPDTLGNMLVLDVNSCVSKGDGKINLGTKLGRVSMDSYGFVTNNMRNNEATFDLVMPINFFFHPEALKMLGQSLFSNNSLNSIDNVANNKIKKAFGEILGEKEAEKVINEINMYGALRRVPDKLDYTMLLSDVKFRYDSTTRSFISLGDIGIGNIGKNQINKYVKGYIQIQKKRTGDVLNIYLELDDAEWYFFTYSNNQMQAYSSMKDFNDFITQEKPEKRRLEAESGMPAYSYYLSTERRKNDFVKRMQAAEVTQDEPEQSE